MEQFVTHLLSYFFFPVEQMLFSALNLPRLTLCSQEATTCAQALKLSLARLLENVGGSLSSLLPRCSI